VALGVVAVAALASFGALALRGRRPVAAPPPAPAAPVRPRPTAVRPEALSPPRPVPPAPAATAHGRLVLDGHFARRIGLLAALGGLELPGKRVRHAPSDHLAAALANILAGRDQLQQISRGERPLRADPALAAAWGQAEFPEVSGVSRLLRAVDWDTAEAVRDGLGAVFAPYVAACAGRARAGGGRLVVDWDLTAKAITTDAASEPFAAYGHMGAGMGKGYQWAEATLRGVGPDGRPRPASLGGFLRPGNTQPPACVERLRRLTEAALGRPWRRPELLAARLTAAGTRVEERRARSAALAAAADGLADRLARAEGRARAAPERVERARRRAEGARARLVAAERRLAEAEKARADLSARLERLRADNAELRASGRAPVAIELVMDAAFGHSDTVAALLEEGYAVTTKAGSPAAMARLLRRAEAGDAVFGPWRPVSANAEVAECAERMFAGCPHPLRLVGYRKHLAASPRRPARTAHALFLTSLPEPERPAEALVDHYHVRGGAVELLNRLAKSYLGFRGHRLRHAPGLDILGQLVFAALNFVPWLADTLWAESGLPARTQPGFAEWMRMARAPADLIAGPDGVLVQFRPESGWPQRTLRLGAVRQPPLPGFAWPGVPIDAQLAA
jgi:hypothetical protein